MIDKKKLKKKKKDSSLLRICSQLSHKKCFEKNIKSILSLYLKLIISNFNF